MSQDKTPKEEQAEPIKVLVVEDSATVRDALVYLFESDPGLKVVGTAQNGLEAVEGTLKLAPDVITMDVIMPDMDGVEATRRIMRQRPTPIVVVTAHAYDQESKVAFEALKAGAMEIVSKPGKAVADSTGKWGGDLVATIKAVASIGLPAKVVDD